MPEPVGIGMGATVQFIPYVGFWDYVLFFALVGIVIAVPIGIYRIWKSRSADPEPAPVPGPEPQADVSFGFEER